MVEFVDSLLSIDPGLRVCGWAYWLNGALYSCGITRAEKVSVYVQAAEHYKQIPYKAQAIVVECMTYRHGRSKGDPQELIDINYISGFLSSLSESEPVAVTPNQWKGCRPRKIEQARTRAALSSAELAILEAVKPALLAHNAWSAVGIGLYVLGRYV